jgi:type II secretory pathway component PulC
MHLFLFIRTRVFSFAITALLTLFLIVKIISLVLYWKESVPVSPGVLKIHPVEPFDNRLIQDIAFFNKAEGESPYRVGEHLPDNDTLYKAPLSKISARLTGVIDGEKGIAIINNGGKQSSYYCGDNIGQGLKLVKIFSDRIIIINNDHYEALILN